MPRKRNIKMNGSIPDEPEQIPLGTINELPPQQELSTKKSLHQYLKEIYYEFCSNTSLHGVQYFGQQRPRKEIIFWIFVFIVSIYFCSRTIYSVYQKWEDTPVIVTFSERSTPVSSIPFPAVTICPVSKIFGGDKRYAKLMNELNQGLGLPSNLTSSELEQFLTLLHVCLIDSMDLTYLKNVTHKPNDYIKILNDISIPLQLQFNSCGWASNRNNTRCDDLFTTAYTDDGLCYTFNGFNGTDLYREDTVQYRIMGLESRANITTTRLNRTLNWSLDKGYPRGIPLKTYPARVVLANSKASLSALLIGFNDFLDYGCSGPTQGFKVVIHTPDDVPLVSKQFVRISLNKEVSIAVKPIMVTTSGRIDNYDPEKRSCYLPGERELKFFKVYSEKNCEQECLTNYTLKICQCVKFSMPRTPDTEVCGADKIECYQNAEGHLLLENFADGDGDKDDDGCNCMPSCTSLEYDTEVSQADFNMKQYLKMAKIHMPIDATFSRLTIYFKDNEYITSKRSELYGLSDFVANCGGVFGLFMGFSFLSLVEILYHCSLRLWSNMTHKPDPDVK